MFVRDFFPSPIPRPIIYFLKVNGRGIGRGQIVHDIVLKVTLESITIYFVRHT